jgi:NAD(P)-dependent dehydrogenase (short-subunit alcohol dehydrogenase family)
VRRPHVFITGAGRGVGRALARRFGAAGYAVAVAGRTEAHVLTVADELRGGGVEAEPIRCDVTDRGAVGAAVARAESRFGPVDVLINNAGAADSAPFVSMPDDMWDRLLAVNLAGTYHCMREVLPGMVGRRRGCVLNIASTAGKTGVKYTSAYCAAKHAVVGLTRAVALEVAAKGVTVNAICPGWLDTDMTQESIARIVSTTGRATAEARAALERMNPQGRLIDPDEVAAFALFLAGPEARAINGQALTIDGGEVLA